MKDPQNNDPQDKDRRVKDADVPGGVPRRTAVQLGALIVVIIVLALGINVWGVWRMSSDRSDDRRQAEAAGSSRQDGSDDGHDDLLQAWDRLQATQAVPSGATRKGGIPVSSKGDKEVDLYTDFMCPACGHLERAIGPELKKLVADGKVRLVIHPISFLDSQSPDRYSTRTASALAYVAENDPDHLLDAYEAFFDKGFQPDESAKKPVTDAAITAQLEKAGVNGDVAASATSGTYDKWVENATNYTTRRDDLMVTMQDGVRRFSTPTVMVDDKRWTTSADDNAGIVRDFDIAVGAADR